MASEEELLQHVKEAVATALGTEAAELDRGTRLFGELGVDSVDLLDICYEIERLTGCELEVAALFGEEEGVPRSGRDLTLADLAQVVRARQAAAAAAGGG